MASDARERGGATPGAVRPDRAEPAPTGPTRPTGSASRAARFAALERDLAAIVARWKSAGRKLTKDLPQAEEARVAVVVRGLEGAKDAPRVALDASRAMRPASNMKLVTSAAALEGLGADGVFRTRFVADGSLERGVLGGDLVVEAGGDPWYLEEAHGSVEAWLRPLVQRLRSAGLTRVKGALVLDETDFAEPGPAPGWPPENQYWSESCALSGGFSANAGCITARVTPGKPGEPARVTLEPRGHGLGTRIDVRTGAARSRLDVAVGVQGGVIVVRGSFPSGRPASAPAIRCGSSARCCWRDSRPAAS